jgi:membrane protease YdiL (CAAX protease family)
MTTPQRSPRASDVYLFFGLALGITWLLDLPYALACIRGVPPPAYALPLVGLGAFGPLIGAFVMGLWRRELRDVFGRWRTNPLWIVVALFAPMALHAVATLVEVALGGHPAQWLYLPVAPERQVALIVFSLGEEFGWRGYAYPRLVEKRGPVIGNLILGLFWGLWHTGMLFAPDKAPSMLAVLAMIELMPWSIVIGWVFERGRRSMAVALAIHAGAHLDNTNLSPESEVRLRLLRFAVVVAAAALAAWALTRRPAPAAQWRYSKP